MPVYDPVRNVDVLDKKKVEVPKNYKVILFNDDYTPVQVVVVVLTSVFRLNEESAFTKMLEAHRSGCSIIVVLPYDVAETKIMEACDCAKKYDAALKFDMEPE